MAGASLAHPPWCQGRGRGRPLLSRMRAAGMVADPAAAATTYQGGRLDAKTAASTGLLGATRRALCLPVCCTAPVVVLPSQVHVMADRLVHSSRMMRCAPGGLDAVGLVSYGRHCVLLHPPSCLVRSAATVGGSVTDGTVASTMASNRAESCDRRSWTRARRRKPAAPPHGTRATPGSRRPSARSRCRPATPATPQPPPCTHLPPRPPHSTVPHPWFYRLVPAQVVRRTPHPPSILQVKRNKRLTHHHHNRPPSPHPPPAPPPPVCCCHLPQHTQPTATAS